MDNCPCLNAQVTVSKDIQAKVSCSDTTNASVSMGTVLIRDGTNDYERLINKPSIEGHTLIGNSTLPQIGVNDITEQAIDQIIFGG